MVENKLTILWANADPITTEFMVFMYAHNSLVHNWWDEVEIIVWGATAKLVAEDKSIQKKLLELQGEGIKIRFCLACAIKLDIVNEIRSLGFDLEYMGIPLTEVLKKDGKLLTV
jgi:hypothetical protein